MPVERIAAFVRSAEAGDFEELALRAFAFQYERIQPYRELCRRRGVEPGGIGAWREIPAVPTLAFKTLELAAAPAREVFRSSGTTGERRSVHHHPYPELYRTVIDATFPSACLGGARSLPMLSLIPSRDQLPDSSLAFLVDHALERWGAPGSAYAFGHRAVEVGSARSWLAARQRDGRSCLILATTFALNQLLEALERMDLRFRLPSGSRLFETGGSKGRTRQLERGDLLARLEQRLALPGSAVVREYGMTELTSHFYAGSAAGADPGLFLPPHWTRVRILDPETLQEAAPGRSGLISVFDLANLGSAVHLLTEDLGRAEGQGFRLAGRAAGAELRGCSLTVEELAP